MARSPLCGGLTEVTVPATELPAGMMFLPSTVTAFWIDPCHASPTPAVSEGSAVASVTSTAVPGGTLRWATVFSGGPLVPLWAPCESLHPERTVAATRRAAG